MGSKINRKHIHLYSEKSLPNGETSVNSMTAAISKPFSTQK